MKKILAGFIMDGHSGGIDKYLLNFLDNVKDNDIRIDFLTNEIHPELKKYLHKYHSRIFAIANLRHPCKQYQQVRRILQKEKYDIVYLNISTAIDCVAAWAARREKISRILLHSHSSGNDCENFIKRIIFNGIHFLCRNFLYRAGTEYFGCSKKAGLWMFPKKIVNSNKFQTIFNAVDLEAFSYKNDIRQEVRKELNLEEKFVIGHVGNFVYQKNHYFLIEIIEALRKKCPEAVLFLVGTGERFEKVQEMIKKKNLEEAVKLLGLRKDVSRLFQGMDCFLLPSYFEGLPTVGVEAQSSGLPCIMSDTITEEAKITKSCWFLSLKKSPEEWAEFILHHRKADRENIAWIGNKEEYSLKELQKRQKQMCIGNLDGV